MFGGLGTFLSIGLLMGKRPTERFHLKDSKVPHMFRNNLFRRLRKSVSTSGNNRDRNRRRFGHIDSLEDRRLMAVMMVDKHDPTPDEDGCGDHENPCNSIQLAVDLAPPLADIIVEPHTYHETVHITKSLAIRPGGGGVAARSGSRATIAGHGAAVVISPGVDFVGLDRLDLKGPGVGVVAEGVGRLELIDVTSSGNGDHGVVFSGGTLGITEGSYSGNGREGIVISGADLFEAINVEIADNGGHGLLAMGLASADIDGTFFAHNGMAGAVFDGTSGDIAMLDTNAVENAHDGMFVADLAGDMTITTSNFEGNGGSGMTIMDMEGDYSSTDSNFRHNELQGLAVVGIEGSEGEMHVAGGDFSHNGEQARRAPARVCGMEARNRGNVNLTNGAVGPWKGDNNPNGAGLCVVDAGNVAVAGAPGNPATFNGNGDHGIDIAKADKVVISNTIATGNKQAGAIITDVASFSDTKGSYNDNNSHGILMDKVRASVKLTNTRVIGNDADNDGTGDGLNARNVGGNVSINNGVFEGNLFKPANPNSQVDGIFLRAVDGDVNLSGAMMTASHNKRNGVDINEVGGDVVITDGTYNANGRAGIKATGTGSRLDDVSIDGATVSGNTDGGIALADVGGHVIIKNVTANDNDRDGDKTGDGLLVRGVAKETFIQNSNFDGDGLVGPQQNGINIGDSGMKVTIDAVSSQLNDANGVQVVRPDGSLTISDSNTSLNGEFGMYIEDSKSAVSVLNTMSDDNMNLPGSVEGDGLFIRALVRPVSATGPIVVRGGSFSNRVKPVTQQWGIDIWDPGNTVTIDGTVANDNVQDGIRVMRAKNNVLVNDSTANGNGDDGIEVNEAVMDVTIKDSTTNGNTVDGIFVTEVVAQGLATDFKVTVDDSIANGNTAAGIRVSNSERALVDDSTADNNTTGILMTEISDDATIKNSSASANAANGIDLFRVNDVNLQFVRAASNGGHGLLNNEGSTIHASGGTFSSNGFSGMRLTRVGDVSTFLTSVTNNSEHGISVHGAGFANFADSALEANGGSGLNVANAAKLTTSNLHHAKNGTDSTVTGTSPILFHASNGEVKDDVELKVEQVADESKPNGLRLSHTRTTTDDEGNEIVSVQDDFVIEGAKSMTLSGGEANDSLTANDWNNEKATLLESLTINGNEGNDHITVSVSTETSQTVNGDAPETSPGDKLTLDSSGAVVVDSGDKLDVAGFKTVHYTGIEELDATLDVTAPTVSIVDVESKGGAVSEISIEFSEAVTGFDLSDLHLSHQSDPLTNLLPAGATLQTEDGKIWTLGNLSSLTLAPGIYEIELDAVDSAIADEFGNELGVSDLTSWENVAGDANGDGVFNSGDLVAIFQASKYRTGRPASYAEGDWNGDGVFNESDLVFAFKHGKYKS